MCGIVGAIGQRKVKGILVEGLKRLEYRGYDSAGLALVDRKTAELACIKTAGKVQALEDLCLRVHPCVVKAAVELFCWREYRSESKQLFLEGEALVEYDGTRDRYPEGVVPPAGFPEAQNGLTLVV